MKPYTVQPGDTLTTIARQHLGNGDAWQQLAALNGIRNPGSLRVGQVIQLPDSEYIVESGDTLRAIAQKTLGDENHWPEIAQLNEIETASALRVGRILKIPSIAKLPPPQIPHPQIPDPQTPESQSPEPQTAQPRDLIPSPAPPSPRSTPSNTYTVQPGDTLSTIAKKTLGNSNRWREIAQINRITNPAILRVGMVLKIPSPTSPLASQPPKASTPSAPHPTPPPSSQPPIPTPPSITAQTYTVQRGDSLISIAQKTLGHGDRWRDIAKANNITNPSALRVGMVLKIPTSTLPQPATPSPAQPSTPHPPNPPQTYTVQPGDSLIKIAQKTLGNGDRWREIAHLNQITSTHDLRIGMVLKIPTSSTATPLSPPTPSPTPPPSATPYPNPPVAGTTPLPAPPVVPRSSAIARASIVQFTQENDTLFAQWPDSKETEVVGITYQQGLYRRGTEHPRSFIQTARADLAKLYLSDSEINAIAALSENEGYLDTVNTWDSQYLSFGLFQWSVGNAERPGELGAFLSRLKSAEPEAFEHYWGQFGLDVEGSDGVRGWITLDGTTLRSDAQKSILRQPLWAYRFAVAGRDPVVQAIEILHAVDRIDKFYFVRQSSLDGYALSRLITSEFGVALLLDHHVNRPAYVASTLAEALWQLDLAPQDLLQGSTAEEQRVLDCYLDIRPSFGSKPMTQAQYRGDRIRHQVEAGQLSIEHGSFISNKVLRLG